MRSPSQEIEIEIEFEDYEVSNDVVIYYLKIETEVVPPSFSTQCRCGIALCTTGNTAPASFVVRDAIVAITNDDAAVGIPGSHALRERAAVGWYILTRAMLDK